MSSYADANYTFRRTRYQTAGMSRRRTLGIKLAAIVVLVTLAWVMLISVAYGGGRNGTQELVVGRGETLWTIAQQRYPDVDTRAMVGQIVQINHLGTSPIYPGERLQVPAN